MKRFSLVVAALALGCPRAAAPTQAPSPSPATAEVDSAALLSLVDEVPAGKPGPLLFGRAQWLPAGLGIDPASTDDTAAGLVAAMDAWDAGMSKARPAPAALRDVVAATWLAERDAAAGKSSVELLGGLERAYAAFDQPYVEFDIQGRQRRLVTYAQARAASGYTLTPDQLHEADTILVEVVRSAESAHRDVAKALLRAAPDRPTTADVLVRVAGRLPSGNDWLAAELVKAALDRAATHRRPVRQTLAAAAVCYRALSTSCGDRAMAMIAGETVADETVVPATKKLGEASRKALELSDRADLASRLELGRTSMTLRRDEEARSIFETAHRQHPEDARPVTGLAQHLIMTRGDFRSAYQIIERSESTEHRDRAYYQISIVTRAATLLNDVLPRAAEENGGLGPALAAMGPYFARLREDVVAYRELGGPEAEVVLFVLNAIEKVGPQVQDRAAMRKTLSALLPSARSVQAAGSTDPAAYRLLLAAAAFSADPDAALAAVRAKPSPLLLVGDTGVRRAQAWIDLAILWERFSELDGADRALVDVGPASSDPRLAESHGVIAAVRARLGDRARWEDAAALFHTAAQTQATPALLNNLGVALVELGRTDEAVAVWQQLGAVGARPGLVELHDAIVARDRDRLQTLARGEDPELQLLATRWLVSLAPNAVERKRWSATLAVAEAAARTDSLRPTLTPGTVGVVLKGEFNFNFQYEAQAGLDLGIGITSSPWLTLQPK